MYLSERHKTGRLGSFFSSLLIKNDSNFRHLCQLFNLHKEKLITVRQS